MEESERPLAEEEIVVAESGLSGDVIDTLIRDHRSVKALFRWVDRSTADGERERGFRSLTRALVRHEFAEERVVFPVLGRLGDPAESEAHSRIREHTVAQELLRSMEHLDVMSDSFAARLATLHGAILRHIQLEELVVFPLLVEGSTSAERRDLALRYQHYVQVAPSHPHPHLPHTPPGIGVVGPLAAAGDRMRDALRSPDDAR